MLRIKLKNQPDKRGASLNAHPEKRDASKVLVYSVCAIFLVTQVAAPAMAQVNFTYDSKNRVKSKTYPNGQGYFFGYDKLGRLASQSFPAATEAGSSGTEYYGYFGPDVFNSFTDLRGLTTSYAVTGVGGFKKSVTAPDTGAFTYQRNSYGRVESYTDARGVTVSVGYGPGNRIASVTYPDNTVTLTYGTPGQPGAGKVVGMTDSSGPTTWGYNRSGQLLSMTQTVGSVTKTVGYTYLGPKLASITYPSGNVVSYEYDRGNLITIKINSVVALSNMKHYPFGSLMSWTTAGAGNYSQTRDLRGRVTAYSFDTGSRAVGWDASNRVTSITNPGSAAWTYGYDNLDRITSATEGGSNRTYAYDLNHNKTGEVLNGAAYNYVIATNSSRIQTATVVNSQNVPETRSYIYDNAGNVLTDGLRTLTWNGAGKVATLTKDGITTTYTYNGQGTRVKKASSLGTTHFVYQGTDVLGEYAGTNGTGSYTETVYAEGVPVALMRDGAIYYVFPDYLGTPRTVKNTTGATVWKWASDPYGVQAPNENPGGVSLFHWNARFPGQYADDESLLYFNNARYYDAPTGRYYSSDPIGLDGGSNTYAYVRGRPLMKKDPTGLADCYYSVSKGQMYCIPWDQNKNEFVNIPVASGNNGSNRNCKNNPACESIKNTGPIPRGDWKWDNEGHTDKPGGIVLVPYGATNTFGRDLFRSHSCIQAFGPSKTGKFCSEGCVTSNAAEIAKLNKLLRAEPGSVLHVQD